MRTRSLNIREFGLTVESYDVGREQLKDLLGSYADIDRANEAFNKMWTNQAVIGLVVKTVQHTRSGCYDGPVIVSWITSYDVAREVISNEYGYDLTFGRKSIYEIWIVRDDAELWQDWEYGVVQSHIAQGWDTDYHLLENCRCVLDCAHELPKVVFCIKTMLADGETVFSVNYYADGESADGALDLDCGLHGCELEDIQAYYATELGITVVNDDDLDEGRADALPVVVFYLRLPDDEQLPSITK